MNKAELTADVAERTGMSQAEAGRAITAMLDSITDTLKKGSDVTLVGFGTFIRRQRAARTGRNPQTGATIDIPAATVPSFKAGKHLKDSVN